MIPREDVNGNGTERFWDARYRSADRMWSGNANATLVSEVAALPPTTALDLGCGEGADAIWLAQLGWHVTAVDVSPTALARGAAQAVAMGVAERVRFEQHDLARSFPAGTYDLVSAQFLQSPLEFPRDRILRAAAGAVARGGRLIVVAHAAFPPWMPEPRPAVRLPTPDGDLETLALDLKDWHVERRDIAERSALGPRGERATLSDSVLVVKRLSEASEHRA